MFTKPSILKRTASGRLDKDSVIYRMDGILNDERSFTKLKWYYLYNIVRITIIELKNEKNKKYYDKDELCRIIKQLEKCGHLLLAQNFDEAIIEISKFGVYRTRGYIQKSIMANRLVTTNGCIDDIGVFDSLPLDIRMKIAEFVAKN